MGYPFLLPCVSQGRGRQSFGDVHRVRCCLPASHAVMEPACGMSHCSLLLPGGFYFGVFFGSLPWTSFTRVGTVFGKSALLFPQPCAAALRGRIRPRRWATDENPRGAAEAAGWLAAAAVPCRAGCAMPCSGCRGSFAAAPGLRYCPPPSCTPYKSPLQLIPAVRPGCVSLPSNQRLLFRLGSSASVP